MSSVDAEIIAYEMREGSLPIKVRNKLIKRLLSEEFGYNNVKVKNGKGTSYGWVKVYITAKKPHNGECMKSWQFCSMCSKRYEEIQQRVYDIIFSTRLKDYIGKWSDDMGYEHHELSIHVSLI